MKTCWHNDRNILVAPQQKQQELLRYSFKVHKMSLLPYSSSQRRFINPVQTQGLKADSTMNIAFMSHCKGSYFRKLFLIGGQFYNHLSPRHTFESLFCLWVDRKFETSFPFVLLHAIYIHPVQGLIRVHISSDFHIQSKHSNSK